MIEERTHPFDIMLFETLFVMAISFFMKIMKLLRILRTSSAQSLPKVACKFLHPFRYTRLTNF